MPARGQGRSPVLVVFAGLPGVGKSTLAERLATELGGAWLRVDSVEASLLAAGIPISFETGLAAYIVVQRLARENLRLGRPVVVDAVNGVEPARRMWEDVARELGVRRTVIEVVCSDPAEHRRRVERRPDPTPPLPPPTWDEVRHREYVPWTEPVLTVDGLRPVEENLARIREYLAAGGSGP
jgi:predicted kinase